MTQHEKTTKYFLTGGQAASLISSTIIGVGVLTLPRSTTDAANQFGWISVIVATLLSVVAVTVIYLLGRRFPEQNLIQFSRELFGTRKSKWVGRIVSFPFLLMYVGFWGFTTAIVVRMFGEVVVTAVLTNTPLEVIVGTMLLLCLLLALYSFEVVARVNEVLLVIIVVPALMIAISSFQSARIELIMPFWPSGHWMDVLRGSMPALTTYLGFETMLLFNGNVKRDKKYLKPYIFGVVTPGVLYLLIVLAGTLSFGHEELSRQAWPTLELIKSVTVPGLILERLEAVFLGVWVAAVFTTAGTWFYCANWMISDMIGLKKMRWKRWVTIGLIVSIYYVAMAMGNIHELFSLTDWLSYLGLVVSCGLPLFLLVLAMIRKMDGRQDRQPKEESQREAG